MQHTRSSDDPFKTVISRLDGVEGRGDQREALCPAHDDTSASLSVSRGNSQPVVLNCHKGCDPDDILDAIGLSWSDLLGDDAATRGDFERAPWDHGEEVEAYQYQDRDGQHVYTVKRYEHPEMPWKTFRPYEPGVEYGPGLDDSTERVLYRLPQVLEAAEEGRVVFIVEGEKDVHTLEERDAVATTSGAADSWKDRFSESLEGAKVVILPDNDDPGREFAEEAAASLYPATEWVRIVELGDVPHAGDVSDWFARGHTAEELTEAVKNTADVGAEEVEELMAEEEPEAEGEPKAEEEPSESPDAEADSDRFTVEDFREELDGLEGRDAEREAMMLLRDVATLSRAEIAQCREILDDHGARARRCRSFESDAKATKKEQESAQEDAAEDTPQELERGELTAWIAGKILQNNTYALDGSGALYYWEGGRYHEGGEEHLNKRVLEVLDAENMTKEFTSYRCGEVQHRIETGAPTLWEHPPQDRLNVKNGVLDLQTGELQEHDPEEWLSTRQLPVEYDPEAEGTAWESVLEDWFPDDGGAEVGFEWIASQIRPAFGRRKATYLYGGKSKGKSTLLRNLVEGLFGPDAVEHMTLQELDGDPFAKADLFGTSLNVCADLPATKLEGTSVFKRITGGDRMSAQRKYEDRFNFTPHCHLIFSGNVPIRAPQAGSPFWDRWIVIPFNGAEFDSSSDDHIPQDELDALLQDPEELSALLNELLRVMPKVREEGVTVTPTMERELRDIRRTPGNDLEHEIPSRGGRPGGDSSPRASEPEPSVSTSQNVTEAEESAGEPEAEPDPGNNGAENGRKRPENRGEGYSKNFEKERDSDTHGVCPESRATKSFQNGGEGYVQGDEVRLPEGGAGTVIERRGDKLLVDPESGPRRKYSPESLSDPDATPF